MEEGADVRRMFLPQATNKPGIRLSGFTHGIIARVEVFSLLQLLLQHILLVGQLAVQPEQLLLFFRELLRTSQSVQGTETREGRGIYAQVDLVLLVWV